MGSIAGPQSTSPTLAQNNQLGKKSKVEEERFDFWGNAPDFI